MPSLTLQSPTNITYASTTTLLNYTTTGTGCWYILNGGANQTLAGCGNTSITSAQGNNNLTVFANDSAGNTNISTVYYFVDSIAPSLTVQNPTNTTYTSTTIPLNYTSNSGVANCWYSLDGGTNTTLINCGNISLSSLAQNNHSLLVAVNDTVGNINTSTVYFSVDTTPPTTTATAIKNSTLGGGSWVSYTFGTWAGSPYVNVSLSCSDGSGSGCDKTYYCNDTANACTPTTLYSSAIQIYTEGTSYIRYYSNDTSGNGETTASQTIKVDTIPPTTTVANATKSNGGDYTFGTWANQTVNITLNCSDSGAGCNPIYDTYYCNDTANTCTPNTGYGGYPSPFQISAEGTSYLRYRSYDQVHYGLGYNDGNLETTNNQTIKIDTTAPATTATAMKEDANPYTFGTWTNQSMSSISFSCNDGSGSGCGTILYCNDTADICTPSIVYSVPINDYGTTGISYFRYRSNDTLGNAEAVKSSTIKIDKDFPYVAIQSPANSTYNTSTPNLNFSAADTSLDKCWYSLDGNTSNISITGCANTTIASVADGSHNITIYVNDSLGNSNHSATINFSVDTVAPTTAIDFLPYVNDTWTTETIGITLTCDDGSGSGCDKVLYCIDTANTCAPTSAYSSTLFHSTNGTSYVRYRSNDTNSNMETAKTRTLRIDADYLCLSKIAYSTFAHNTSLQPAINEYSTQIALAGNVTYNNTCTLALTNYLVSLASKDAHVSCGASTDCITTIGSLASGANITDAISAYFDLVATESAINPVQAIFANLQIQQKTHLYINDTASINVNAVSFQHAFLATSCRLFKCEQETCAYVSPPWSANLQINQNAQPATHSNGTFTSNYLQFATACTDSGLVGGGGGGGGGPSVTVNQTNETRLSEPEIRQQIIEKVGVFPAFAGIDSWLRGKPFGVSNALLLSSIFGMAVGYKRLKREKIDNADIIIIVVIFALVALYWQVFP